MDFEVDLYKAMRKLNLHRDVIKAGNTVKSKGTCPVELAL